jgi:hypothetical protein
MRKYERYGPILDVVVHDLREGRDRDAVGVIDAIPDEEVRSFTYFACLHIAQGLNAIAEQKAEILARDRPSENRRCDTSHRKILRLPLRGMGPAPAGLLLWSGLPDALHDLRPVA